MKLTGITKIILYISVNDDNWELVDLRASLDKFYGPGMIRDLFGKIFPKERPLPIVPKRITDHPRLQNMIALQAVSSDGWIAIALGGPPEIQTAEMTDEKSSIIR